MSQSRSDTVGPIIFSDKIARKQLVEQGEVVTFRKTDRTTGETWWRETRCGTKEGDVLVEEIGEVDPANTEDLKPHRPLSGFQSVREWQEAIQELNGELPDRGHLYRVQVRR